MIHFTDLYTTLIATLAGDTTTISSSVIEEVDIEAESDSGLGTVSGCIIA